MDFKNLDLVNNNLIMDFQNLDTVDNNLIIDGYRRALDQAYYNLILANAGLDNYRKYIEKLEQKHPEIFREEKKEGEK